MQTALGGESPVGIWKTIDDDGITEKSYVEIYRKEGLLYGKIVKLLKDPADTVCDKCTGAKKNKPLIGMEIITGLKQDGRYFSDGTIMDPENGKTYRCRLWREGNHLKVRGYLSLFFRTQTWLLVAQP